MLGCGPSWGVPPVGGDWGECDPLNPRNRRRRVSVLIEDEVEGRGVLLIDTSPDLREQLLEARVTGIDAVLYTHAHADHLHGIDDLRSLNRLMGRPIPIYGNDTTIAEIRQRFGYVLTPLDEAAGPHYYKPMLVPEIITGRFQAAG
ncbi:MAG TPA: MBL fold metallo-hydrolase, partial [Stellaceae bacterium]|nr:MBL fold metallo-hydrolase [Stellaceae bacterium]